MTVGAESRAELRDGPPRNLAKAIDRGLTDRTNRLLEFSRDGQQYLVYSSGIGVPGEYYIGNRKTVELSLQAEDYQQLDPRRLVGK